MTVYRCKCSFSSSSATTFHRHLRRFKDEEGDKHQMVLTNSEHFSAEPDKDSEDEEMTSTDAGAAEPPLPQATESPPLANKEEDPRDDSNITNKPGRSMLERLSFAGAIGSLWSSPEAGKHAEHSGLLRGQSPRFAVQSPSQQNEATSSQRANDADLPEPGSPLAGDCSSSDWEAVNEDPGYKDITRALLAAGETPADATASSWVPSTMTRTFNMIWGSGRPDDAASLAMTDAKEGELAEAEPMKLSQLLPSLRGQVQVEDLEDVLLWRDPMVTTKFAGAGLYILICLRHLVNGVELVQPSTVLAAAALGLLGFNSAKAAWLRHRHSIVATQQSRNLAEARLRDQTGDFLARRCAAVTPLASALVALVGRRLSGQGSAGARFWLGASLWSCMCIAELGWVSQSTLALWIWAALFTLPTLYTACRAALDALVEESLAFLLAVLAGGQKGVLLASGAAGLLSFALLDARIFVRLTFSVLSSASVLLVSARRLSILKAADGAPALAC